MKRRLHILSLVAILLALCIGSCGDAGHPTFGRGDEKAFHAVLRRAENLMDTDPHAARAVLDSLKIVNRQSSNSKSLADYAWLRTQIEYKCDIPLTSDSLARIATDYYGTPRCPDYHAAMAWYTLGCAYKDMSDDINGTDAFLKAKSLFPDTLIRYYALAEQNLGLHYLNRFMKEEAFREFTCAKDNFIRLTDSTAVAFLDLHIAQCYLYKEDYIIAKDWLVKTVLPLFELVG